MFASFVTMFTGTVERTHFLTFLPILIELKELV